MLSFASIRKGTGMPNSDWDSFIHLHYDGDTVTQKQQMDICRQLSHHLEQQGIEYLIQLGDARVWLYAGSDALGALPDAELVFKPCKGSDKVLPGREALAGQIARQVRHEANLLPGSGGVHLCQLTHKLQPAAKHHTDCGTGTTR